MRSRVARLERSVSKMHVTQSVSNSDTASSRPFDLGAVEETSLESALGRCAEMSDADVSGIRAFAVRIRTVSDVPQYQCLVGIWPGWGAEDCTSVNMAIYSYAG